MKPFQLVVIAVFGFLALVGLFVFANFTGNRGNGTGIGAVTIWGVLPAGAIQAAIDKQTVSDAAYKQVTYVARDPATFASDLAEAIATGHGPDLVLLSQEQLLATENKLSVIPYSAIPERTFLDSYESIFNLYLTDTGTYGIPLATDPLVLYDNQTILTTAGVVGPPSSWEQLFGLVPLLTKQTNAQSITQSAIAFGGYANVTHASAILSTLFLQAGSAITEHTANGLHAALASSGAAHQQSPAVAAVRFYTQFADPAKSSYTWNPSLPNSYQYFVAGNLALYLGFPSEVSALRSANPNLRFDMAPMPFSSTGGEKTVYARAYAFSIPKASANKTGAYAVASTLSGGALANVIAQGLSMAPARLSLLTPDSADPYQAVYYREALIAKAWLSPLPSVTDAIFAGMISDVTSGRQTVEDAINAADRSLDAALSP